MDRRQFIAAGVAGLAAQSAAQGQSFVQSPAFTGSRGYDKDKVRRVGLIGTGWYGKIDLLRLIQVSPVEVVSLCDVDKNQLEEAGQIVASRQRSKKVPRFYSDYRQMLAQKDLDIVLIATPDHWHALPMIEAVKSGIDVYCQKPISVDVEEGRAMLAAARKYNRVVQVGMQRRSTPHLAEAREQIVKAGKLGKVGLVEVYCYYHMRATGNPPDTPPPANLDYEMWTGPAPMRPYCTFTHPRRWRAFMEYGNGIVGDMCVHMFDMTRWMLGLGWPKSISSAGGILVDKDSKANITDTQTVTFRYDDLEVIWQHRTWGSPNDPDSKNQWGASLYGDKGTLRAGVFGYDFLPAKGEAVHRDVTYEYEQFPEDRTEKDLERHVSPAVRYHMQNLLSCIDRRDKPVSDIEEGFISASSCILGNMALKLGRELKYDPQQHRVAGDEEATRMLRRAYRAPWTHPAAEKV
jgi:predicted dehydrogenase